MRITKKSTTFVLFLALGAGTSSAQEPPRGAVCNREAAVTFGRDRRTAPDSSATGTGTFFAYWHKSGCDRLKNEGRSSDRLTGLRVELPGLEPGKTGPESVVLPLHHSSMSHGTTRSTCPPLPVGPKSCDARCDCRSLRFGDAKVAHNFALCKKNPKNFSNFVSARFPAHRKPDDRNRILEHQHDEYKNPPRC